MSVSLYRLSKLMIKKPRIMTNTYYFEHAEACACDWCIVWWD